MIRTNLFNESEVHKITQKAGCFSLLEYTKDVSVSPYTAVNAYYCSQMGVHKRQVIANLEKQGIVLQSGAMQMTMGNVEINTNVQGAGDLLKKFVGSKASGESAIKPKYVGTGTVVLEPTYRYVLFEDIANWGGSLIIDDGLFLACDDTVDMKITVRNNLSSAVLGGEGLFNTCLQGHGIAVLESPVPREELIVIDLENDVVKIDGNMAIAWTSGLQFTVERTTKTLVGSAASGEGLVNVYRGTGRILVAPVKSNPMISTPHV